MVGRYVISIYMRVKILTTRHEVFRLLELRNCKQTYDWKGLYDSTFPLLASIHASPYSTNFWLLSDDAKEDYIDDGNQVVVSKIMVGGYAIEGNYRLVDIFFEVMQQHGFKPNSVIFTSLLSACCQESAIKEGEFYFNIMETYGVIPTIEHVTCMVDLLWGAGYLNDAKRILNISSSHCNIIGWMSLLTACKTYGNVKLGRQCFDKLWIQKLGPYMCWCLIFMLLLICGNM